MTTKVANPFADAPPPPPKNRHYRTSKTPDLETAVVDTVMIHGRRMGRSNTAALPPAKPPQLGLRSQSTDSAVSERAIKAAKAKKKGSQHADVIDRLDFTGVGAAMFHHDGPFDACAPSRNRHHTRAPMMAWSKDSANPDQSTPEGPYPSHHNNSYPYEDKPRKKVDAIAEAWGIHEPEPFEEFFAGGGVRGDTPASSIYNGKDSHGKRTTKDGRDSREVYREYLDDRSRPARRRDIPPPQPIFVPDATAPQPDLPVLSSSPSSPGLPKRSKSLMHRIRKMRDNPNVPVGSDFEESPSSPGYTTSPVERSRERPTHRSNNSFLGRFGTTPKSTSDSPLSEPFIFIAPSNGTEKDLPATPGDGISPKENGPAGYFEAGTSPNSGGLGRKTSLMKKVGRVVRGRS
jgi:hypothetical protein